MDSIFIDTYLGTIICTIQTGSLKKQDFTNGTSRQIHPQGWCTLKLAANDAQILRRGGHNHWPWYHNLYKEMPLAKCVAFDDEGEWQFE